MKSSGSLGQKLGKEQSKYILILPKQVKIFSYTLSSKKLTKKGHVWLEELSVSLSPLSCQYRHFSALFLVAEFHFFLRLGISPLFKDPPHSGVFGPRSALQAPMAWGLTCQGKASGALPR